MNQFVIMNLSERLAITPLPLSHNLRTLCVYVTYISITIIIVYNRNDPNKIKRARKNIMENGENRKEIHINEQMFSGVKCTGHTNTHTYTHTLT